MAIQKFCEQCGKEFWVSPSVDARGRGKYCSKKCFYEVHAVTMVGKRRNRVGRTCEFCGKAFEIIPSWLKGGGGKYCSRECQSAQKKTVTGQAHPLYKEKVKLVCKFCQQPFYVKPSERDTKFFCSRRCHGAWRAQSIHSPTTIERTMASILTSMGVYYEAEKGIGPWLCDFVIESSALVIETDGKYWHSLPERKKKDQQKDRWLNTHGYAVLRLGEDDINNNPEWCKRKIQSLLIPEFR